MYPGANTVARCTIRMIVLIRRRSSWLERVYIPRPSARLHALKGGKCSLGIGIGIGIGHGARSLAMAEGESKQTDMRWL
jgi:hypothetical protein